MMTLVEFLNPIKKEPHREKCLAVMYYKQRYEGVQSMTVEQVRTALIRTRIPKAKTINVADVLARCGALVDSPGTSGARRLWKLTPTGERHVRGRLGLPESQPEIEHDAGSLRTLASGIKDGGIRDFIDESVRCLEISALRAAVVFLWSGAIFHLRQLCLKKNKKRLNAALLRHDPKARTVSSIDHFSYIKDKTLLLACEELGLLDKSERTTLEESLNLRNRCSHPTKYRPGVKKVSSFVEDIAGIVFKLK